MVEKIKNVGNKLFYGDHKERNDKIGRDGCKKNKIVTYAVPI